MSGNKDKGWRFFGKERQYIEEVLSSGFSAGDSGTMNERLENAFAEKHRTGFAITANSGTSTLHMALRAFGVEAGDEVIIPALTVAMCGYAVWQTGAIPVYADVEADTFLISPADIERKITPKTKAIMPVHLYGNMCNMESIMEIAKKHNLFVVEDCAQCFLATDKRGRIAGTVGDVGSWSFENTKHMTTGDGGIVTTNSEDLAIKMRQFGGVGFLNLTAKTGKVRISKEKFQDPDWKRHNVMAYNYRLPEICAALGLAQLESLEYFVKLRQNMGNAYRNLIKESGTRLLINQGIYDGYSHTYFTFPALFNGSEFGIKWQEFRAKFMSFGGDGIYAAWQTVNNEPAFAGVGWGDVPTAEKLQRNLMHFTTNQRDEDEVEQQISAMKKTLEFFRK